MTDFNPNSTDAMLAKILANQEEHGHILKDNLEQILRTKDRVVELEKEKWYVRGITASIAIFAGGLWQIVRDKMN